MAVRSGALCGVRAPDAREVWYYAGAGDGGGCLAEGEGLVVGTEIREGAVLTRRNDMEYLKLLEHSFEMEQGLEPEIGRLEYLSIHIFDFTTYDGEMDALFAKKALEVCIAISDRKTFEYQKDKEDYKWYLLMVNMPFFSKKLEWGTSIRGAWWNLHGDKEFEISSCGFWEGDSQLDSLKFNEIQWSAFVKAMQDFVAVGNP